MVLILKVTFKSMSTEVFTNLMCHPVAKYGELGDTQATLYTNCGFERVSSLSAILDAAASEVVLVKDVILVTLRGKGDADSVFLGHEIMRRELGLSVRSLKRSSFEFPAKSF